jgi:hypothetical protein
MSQRWWTTPRWSRALIGAAVAVLLAVSVDAIFFKDNDFECHRWFGQRFLSGEPYSRAGMDMYVLGRGMLDVLPALLPYRLSRAVVFCIALAALAASFALILRMADRAEADAGGTPPDRATSLAACGLTLLIYFPILLRDFQECGLHLILMAMLVAGGYALWSGWSVRAGFWLGLALTYKTTSLLFLPVLLWKRRWQAAVCMVVFTVALNVLPAAYLGWDATLRAHRKVFGFMQEMSRIEDIAENGIEPPNGKNQGLPAFFARYLQSYPPGHTLHEDHPWFVQFGALDHATARLVFRAALLVLGAFVAWRMWGGWGDRDARLPHELATTCAFCALLSPMCWRQHLVAVLPALLLLVRRQFLAPSRLGRLWLILVGVIVWVPQRELMGKSLAYTLMSYKPDTFVVTALSLALLFLSPVAGAVGVPGRKPIPVGRAA